MMLKTLLMMTVLTMMITAMSSATTAPLYARIQKRNDIHPQSYMLELKNVLPMSPVSIPGRTPTPTAVPIFSDTPNLTCK